MLAGEISLTTFGPEVINICWFLLGKANKHRKDGKRKAEKKSTGGKEKDDEKKGISLSGLLNVRCLSRVIPMQS
jgi:hypothetical protein